MNILLQDVSVHYKNAKGKNQALRALTSSLCSGLNVLMGDNGSGKTTLLRVLSGLRKPDFGQVFIDGRDFYAHLSEFRSVIGYLPQSFGFYPQLSGEEMLDYIAIVKGVTDKRLRRRMIEEVISRMRLEDIAKRRTKEYSGGMKQRLGIAQTLLGDPDILLWDEPSEGLDVETRALLRDVLLEMRGEKVVVLSTHILSDIAASCRKVLVLRQGSKIFDGTYRQMAGTESAKDALSTKALEKGYIALMQAEAIK